jgi:hypothetical protein
MRRPFLFTEKKMAKKHPTTIRANEYLEPLLKKYAERFGGQSKAVTSVFLCYDTMMRLERRKLKDIFSQAEINIMLNNAMSAVYTPQAIPGVVLSEMEDEVDATFEFFGVDRVVLLEGLRNLTLSQQFALADWLTELKGNEADDGVE